MERVSSEIYLSYNEVTSQLFLDQVVKFSSLMLRFTYLFLLPSVRWKWYFLVEKHCIPNFPADRWLWLWIKEANANWMQIHLSMSWTSSLPSASNTWHFDRMGPRGVRRTIWSQISSQAFWCISASRWFGFGKWHTLIFGGFGRGRITRSTDLGLICRHNKFYKKYDQQHLHLQYLGLK